MILIRKSVEFYKKGSKTDALYEYMQYGGMPLAVLSDEDAKKQYLKGLFETTYFKDAFILQEATRYDIRSKKEIGALRKYYFVDTGLRNAQLNFAYPDERQLLENIVYNELIYNGYTVNVRTFDTIEKNKTGKYIRKTNEIDFFAQKNERKFYIQISTDVSNSETKDREIRPSIKLNDQIQKILVVNKPYKAMVDNQRYIIISASEFLLNYIK